MSKELEALARIVGCSTIESHRPKWQEDYKVVETALKDYEKQKQLVQTLQDKIYVKEMKYAKTRKALEIIKEKEVVVSLLIWSDTLDQYNNNTMLVFSKLTQEEYELLKEVLS